MRELRQQGTELVDRQIARKRWRGSAAARRLARLGRRQVLGLQARHLCKPFTQPVKLQQLGLQLSQPDGHRIEVTLNDLLRLASFLPLVVEENSLKERMLDRGRVAQRHVIEEEGKGQKQQQQTQAPKGPVSPVQRQGARPAHSAGHDNNVQMPCSPCCQSSPHASRSTEHPTA